MISCDQSETLFLLNCFQLEESIFIVDGCHISIDHERLEESLSRAQKPFKFNSISKEKHFNRDPMYPNCNPEWNKVEIRNSLSSWKSSLSTFYFPFWFHNSSSEPLDKFEPKIRITLPFFYNRRGYLESEVSIGTKKRVFLKGLLVNGVIEGSVKNPDKLYKLFDLKWFELLFFL